ncbi:diaminobutyrate--2-oxoglutarate aminotransferase, partial [Vibrio parahaemolyticus VPTS-2010]
QAQTMRW